MTFFFVWLWGKHLVHFSRLVPNQSRHQTLWRCLRGAPRTAGIWFHWPIIHKYFYAPLEAKNSNDWKSSQLSVKILLPLLVQKRGTSIPPALFLDIKEREESMYMQKNLLVSDPESRLLLAFHGRWMGLSPISDLIKPVWAHEVRKMAGREAQLLLKNTNFNFLTCVPRSCTSVPQTHQAQNILCFPFAVTFCQQQLFFLSLLAFHLLSPSKQP